jgi:heme-degrading monooxygenase HmoA
MPGLKGYDWYKYETSRKESDVREREYPKYLSIIYFENTQAFDGFVKSPEAEAFFKMMRSVFPRGLKYEWYAQYQLVKSFRR